VKIETGEPRESGSYVCYMHGVDVPTVIRFWLVGTGWLNNLKEPVAGSVAAWVGPLPVIDVMRKLPPFVKAPTQEFDL